MVNHVTMSIKFKVIALKEHLLDFLSRPLHKRLALEEGLLDKVHGSKCDEWAGFRATSERVTRKD
jgi:hypothetical protein